MQQDIDQGTDNEPLQQDQSPAGDPLSTATTQVGPARAVDDELFAELGAVAAEEGCELLHVGRSGNALQLVVDHVDGVTLEHCGKVSRQAGALLDGLDYGRGRYVLEVSSPGLDREFYSSADYAKYIGRPVKTVHRHGGRKATLRGTLSAFDESTGMVEIIEADVHTDKATHRIPLGDIQTTRLEIEL